MAQRPTKLPLPSANENQHWARKAYAAVLEIERKITKIRTARSSKISPNLADNAIRSLLKAENSIDNIITYLQTAGAFRDNHASSRSSAVLNDVGVNCDGSTTGTGWGDEWFSGAAAAPGGLLSSAGGDDIVDGGDCGC
jgi:hypothetical protein